MRECRFYPWCSYIEDHGCTKDPCRHYQPMPDVVALAKLADEIEDNDVTYCVSAQYALDSYASRIREACGEVA